MSTNAFLLFEQATRIEPWKLGNEQRVLVFGRKVIIDGAKLWQIVAYDCDEQNRVTSWRKRYDVTGPKFNATMFNLAYRICNDLIEPQLIENLRNS